MKRGKKYQDAVKNFDKAAQYDVAEVCRITDPRKEKGFTTLAAS